MKNVLRKLEVVAETAVDQLASTMSGPNDVVSDGSKFSDAIKVLSVFATLHKADTARGNAVVKMAIVLGLKKQGLLPVYEELTGVVTTP